MALLECPARGASGRKTTRIGKNITEERLRLDGGRVFWWTARPLFLSRKLIGDHKARLFLHGIHCDFGSGRKHDLDEIITNLLTG
jgi:hypothetical protein